MRGADCVCHFASAFRETGVSDEFFLEVNVAGARNAIEAAAGRVSGDSCCAAPPASMARGAGSRRRVARRAIRGTPTSRSKVEAEDVVRSLAAAHGMEYAIIRPAVVYGPHDERLVKMFAAASRGRFPLFGPGKGRRHMVYVGDVVDAALRACVCRPRPARK